MGWNIGTCSARKRLRSGRRWCGFVAGHGDVPERTSPLADSPRAIQASLDTRIVVSSERFTTDRAAGFARPSRDVAGRALLARAGHHEGRNAHIEW
jgi:hypothetical protein